MENAEETKPEATPVQGSVKWELNNTGTSRRVKKKLDLLGQNVVVAKIEQTSGVDEASVPSVYELTKPGAQ